MAHFVLVHGSWYGSATWQPVSVRLGVHGHATVAVERAAFGLNARFPASYLRRPLDVGAFATEASAVAGVSLQDDVDGVVQVLRAAREAGAEHVVLVGHSSGGLVITSVAQQHPELVDHLVYVAAFMPADGDTGLADLQSGENGHLANLGPLFLGDPSVTGALRVDWRSEDGAYQAALKEGFFAEATEGQFRAASASFTPDDPFSPYLEQTVRTAERWGSVPRTFVRTSRDAAILPALYDRWIAAADAVAAAPTRVHEVDASHSVQLSHPGDVAEILLSVAADR